MDAVLKAMRTPLAKWITRLLLYGVGLLVALMGMEVPEEAETQAGQIGEAAAGLLMILAGMGIDYLHHRTDKREMPDLGRGARRGAARMSTLLLLALAAAGAGIGVGCQDLRPPETLAAQYWRESETFSDTLDTLHDLRLVGMISPDQWRDHVLPAAEAANRLLEAMKSDLDAGRSDPWTVQEGLGSLREELQKLLIVEEEAEARRRAVAMPPTEAGMSGEAWLFAFMLVSGLLDRLLRLLERNQVTDVTPDQVRQATDRRRQVMARARAAAEGNPAENVAAAVREIVGEDPDDDEADTLT